MRFLAALRTDVSRANPQVEQLVQYFRFIANYRLDDVMLSYATCGGGVGPHIDNYDVFLIQARGKRQWRLRLSPMKRNEEDWLPYQVTGLIIFLYTQFFPKLVRTCGS